MACTERQRLDHLGDMEVELVAELGRRRVRLDAVRRMVEGSVVVLDRRAGEAFDIKINGALLGEGEIVVANDRMGCRITRLAPTAKEALP